MQLEQFVNPQPKAEQEALQVISDYINNSVMFSMLPALQTEAFFIAVGLALQNPKDVSIFD